MATFKIDAAFQAAPIIKPNVIQHILKNKSVYVRVSAHFYGMSGFWGCSGKELINKLEELGHTVELFDGQSDDR